EVVGEQRGHPLLAAADLELLGIFRLRPRDRQPDVGEHLVERRPVAVALGVGEHAVAVEDQRRHDQTAADVVADARPAEPNVRMWYSAISLTAARTCLKSDGGSCLPGLASRYSRCASMNAIFSAVEMLTFAQPRAMRSANCASVRPVPPWSTMGIGCCSTSSVTRSGVS